MLLDTCALLWWFGDDPRLGKAALRHVEDDANDVVISVVSLWEIAVKRRSGKLAVSATTVQSALAQGDWKILGILPAHLAVLETLPAHHRDPFDHLLISQAIAEDCTFITEDGRVASYPVRHLRC